MLASGFTNSWTSGEISDDAWDRADLQPVAKGCEEASNLVVRIAGPLGKRRGFWDLGAVQDEAELARLIPFRRSIDDALMLEFGDEVVTVWAADGALYAGPVTFASPWTAAQLAGLRWKQVADVIYFRHRDGLAPYSLTRNSNTSWTFAAEAFEKGPWRPENLDKAWTLTVTGSQELDANGGSGAGSILVGQAVTLVASQATFQAGHVGACFRTRGTDGQASVLSWTPAYKLFNAVYMLSVGHVYRSGGLTSSGGNTGTNLPVHLSGTVSDGTVQWAYRHDGAGIIKITAVTDSTHAAGVVVATHPLPSAVATSFWAESAYSDYRGWPRMWPAVREERLVSGATAADLDKLDLTTTAGFTPTTEDYTPGLGTGQVVDTDAVRERLGDDGGELIWAAVAPYLIVGSSSGEYLVGANLVDDAIKPGALVKKVGNFGSADVAPALAHKSILHVARGGQTLRELVVDASMQTSGDDLTVLSRHIAERTFAQLGWVSQPDEVLWARLADGGLAALTYHQEQNVRGWTRQALPGGFIVEDLAVLPGPGRLDTLWLVVSRTKDAATQRRLWMLSAATDGLFLDGAAFYEGSPVTTVTGLAHLNGEAVRGLADGAQFDATVSAGNVTIGAAASTITVGLKYAASFKSLKLDVASVGGTLGMRERVTAAIVSIKTVVAKVGLAGSAILETISARRRADVAAPTPRRVIHEVNLAGGAERDPRLTIVDDSAYDCVIYSVRPKIQVGA